MAEGRLVPPRLPQFEYWPLPGNTTTMQKPRGTKFTLIYGVASANVLNGKSYEYFLCSRWYEARSSPSIFTSSTLTWSSRIGILTSVLPSCSTLPWVITTLMQHFSVKRITPNFLLHRFHSCKSRKLLNFWET